MTDQDPKPSPGPGDAKTPEKKVETKEIKPEGKEQIKIEKLEHKDFKDNKEHKEHKERKDHKDHKIEVKEHKPETKEQKDHKERKDQKDHKIEVKEHKIEVKEHKPESKELKDQQKPEIKEKETIKIEGKEIQFEGPVQPVEPADVDPRAAAAAKVEEAAAGKVQADMVKKPEFTEKHWRKEFKDFKDIREYFVELPPHLPIPDPVEERLAALEQAVVEMSHFIQSSQRPDLSGGALSSEPDAGEDPGPAEGEE